MKDLKDVVRASRTERTIYQHLIRNDEACLITLTNLTFSTDVWYTWVCLSLHITPLLQPFIYHSYLNPFQEGKAEKILFFWCVHAHFMIIFDPCVILSCSWSSAIYIIIPAAAVFVAVNVTVIIIVGQRRRTYPTSCSSILVCAQ